MDDVVLLATDENHALAAARLCNFPTGKAMLLPAHIAWLDNVVARLLRSSPDPWVTSTAMRATSATTLLISAYRTIAAKRFASISRLTA